MREDFSHPTFTSSTRIILNAFVLAKQNRLRIGTLHSNPQGLSINAPASWTAVAEMHGASLHRRHRFREVKPVLFPQPAPVSQHLLRRLPLSSASSLRHPPTPTGSRNIAKGCRASARQPWYPCQLPESKPITPKDPTTTSSVCNELRRASVRETNGPAQLLLQAWY
jgi:hypothetical protein